MRTWRHDYREVYPQRGLGNMSCTNGNRYVGLTDDPERRRNEHNNPPDWRIERRFTSEREARQWEANELSRPGHCGGTGGEGWHVGYKYTVTPSTRE